MMCGTIISCLLIYGAWLIRCLINSHEEKYEAVEESGMVVTAEGKLIETKTTTFKQIA
jgi:hypothetical protein